MLDSNETEKVAQLNGRRIVCFMTTQEKHILGRRDSPPILSLSSFCPPSPSALSETRTRSLRSTSSASVGVRPSRHGARLSCANLKSTDWKHSEEARKEGPLTGKGGEEEGAQSDTTASGDSGEEQEKSVRQRKAHPNQPTRRPTRTHQRARPTNSPLSASLIAKQQ